MQIYKIELQNVISIYISSCISYNWAFLTDLAEIRNRQVCLQQNRCIYCNKQCKKFSYTKNKSNCKNEQDGERDETREYFLTIRLVILSFVLTINIVASVCVFDTSVVHAADTESQF